MNKLRPTQYIFLAVLFAFGIVYSCNSKKTDFKTIFNEAKANLNLPINFSQGVDLTECYVDDERNALIYEFSVTDPIFENINKSTYDENAKLSMITTISSSPFFDELCKSGMEYVVKFKSQNGTEKEIAFENEELIELVQNIRTSKSNDFLSAMRQEIGATFFPVDCGDIICLSGVVDDNSVTYEYQYADSVDLNMITPEFVAYQKETMTHSVKESARPYIDEMIEKGYSMNYIMRNINGEILFTISFSGNDLK